MKVDATVPVRAPDTRGVQTAAAPGIGEFQLLWAAATVPVEASPSPKSDSPLPELPVPETERLVTGVIDPEPGLTGQVLTTAEWRVSGTVQAPDNTPAGRAVVPTGAGADATAAPIPDWPGFSGKITSPDSVMGRDLLTNIAPVRGHPKLIESSAPEDRPGQHDARGKVLLDPAATGLPAPEPEPDLPPIAVARPWADGMPTQGASLNAPKDASSTWSQPVAKAESALLAQQASKQTVAVPHSASQRAQSDLQISPPVSAPAGRTSDNLRASGSAAVVQADAPLAPKLEVAPQTTRMTSPPPPAPPLSHARQPKLPPPVSLVTATPIAQHDTRVPFAQPVPVATLRVAASPPTGWAAATGGGALPASANSGVSTGTAPESATDTGLQRRTAMQMAAQRPLALPERTVADSPLWGTGHKTLPHTPAPATPAPATPAHATPAHATPAHAQNVARPSVHLPDAWAVAARAPSAPHVSEFHRLTDAGMLRFQQPMAPLASTHRPDLAALQRPHGAAALVTTFAAPGEPLAPASVSAFPQVSVGLPAAASGPTTNEAVAAGTDRAADVHVTDLVLPEPRPRMVMHGTAVPSVTPVAEPGQGEILEPAREIGPQGALLGSAGTPVPHRQHSAPSEGAPIPPTPPTWPIALARIADAHSRLPTDRASPPATDSDRPADGHAPRAQPAATPVPATTAPWLAHLAADQPASPEASARGVEHAAAVPAHEPHAPRAAAPDTRPPPAVPQQIAEAMRIATGNRVELTLAPEELGRVTLSFQPDGDRVLVHLIADRPETMDLLRRHAPDLATELRAAGYESASFSFGRQGQAPQDRLDASSGSETDTSLDTTPAPPPRPVSAASGALDLRL